MSVTAIYQVFTVCQILFTFHLIEFSQRLCEVDVFPLFLHMKLRQGKGSPM